MPTRLTVPPRPEELEVSILGPGYGESIAVHIGDGRWVLVDSCVEPTSRGPGSVQYLRQMGLDVSQCVEMVVASHWHDDHVRGIAATLRDCTNAKFAMSGALLRGDFVKLVERYGNPMMQESSGLDEFAQVFDILQARKQAGSFMNSPKLAIMDRTLLQLSIEAVGGMTQVKIVSLSPSDASIMKAEVHFAQLLPQAGSIKKRIPCPGPNHSSVVLWIEAGEEKVLLASDLEATDDPMTGWSVILDNRIGLSGKASVFKVPHHGGESGHEPRVWSELLLSEPCAVLSPFRLGGVLLPTPNDAARITRLTPHAYITAPPIERRHKWGTRIVRETVRDATRWMRNVHCGWGQIRLRRALTTPDASWELELFGDASTLSPDAWVN